MKNVKGFTLGLVLGLSIAIAGIGFAQNTAKTDANNKSECCCMSMDSSNGDSCPMMKDGAMKDGATKSEGHGCCCCGGESCEMNHTKHMKDNKTKP